MTMEYVAELKEWTERKQNFENLVKKAEEIFHDDQMMGKNGVGLLTNKDGEFGLNDDDSADPYLMTDEEKKFVKAKKEYEYWQEQLEIAEAVLKYADPKKYDTSHEYSTADGKRESAEKTEYRKNELEKEVNAAKSTYTASITAVNDIVKKLEQIKGIKPADDADDATKEAWKKSLAYLGSQLAEQKILVEKAHSEYLALRKAQILVENGSGTGDGKNGGKKYIEAEYREIKIRLVNSRKEMIKREKEWYMMASEAPLADALGAYGDLVASVIADRVKADERLAAYARVEELTTENAESWKNSVLDVLADDADAPAREMLKKNYTAWKEISADKPDQKKEAWLRLTYFAAIQKKQLENAAAFTQELLRICTVKDAYKNIESSIEAVDSTKMYVDMLHTIKNTQNRHLYCPRTSDPAGSADPPRTDGNATTLNDIRLLF
jgi:hypothetical protein